MTPKNEQTLAFALVAVSLVIGVVCYAAFPVKAPEKPVRLIFKTSAGTILFDHKMHTADSGIGLACDECHHEEIGSCTGEDCHGPDSDPKRSEALHTNCRGCHEENDSGPVECPECHVMK